MNITIYVRREFEDRFKEETDKSKLINQLLEKHYGVGEVVEKTPHAEQGQRNAPIVIENLGTGKKTEVLPALTFIDEQLEPEFQDWVQEEYGWDANRQCAVHKESGETERAKLVQGKIILL